LWHTLYTCIQHIDYNKDGIKLCPSSNQQWSTHHLAREEASIDGEENGKKEGKGNESMKIKFWMMFSY
jgi:hypothetical protein